MADRVFFDIVRLTSITKTVNNSNTSSLNNVIINKVKDLTGHTH